jgi:outer membrane protein TolC
MERRLHRASRFSELLIFGNYQGSAESNTLKPMNISRRQSLPGVLLWASLFGAVAGAQDSGPKPLNLTVPASTVYGSVSSGPPVDTVVPLSLDDAIRRGLQTNLQTTLVKQNQRIVSGERLEAINYLMPNLSYEAERERLQINLAAEGFSSKVIHSFPPEVIPPQDLNDIPVVVTVNAVIAQADLTQSLFDLQSYELYRAAKQEIKAVDFSYQSSRGQVIQTVADTYLRALAAAANVDNAEGLLATNAEVLRQATLKHQAGVVARLDELRARVQYQQQQQVVIAQKNAFEKAKVDLNREIGLPADQPIQLTDSTPYASLATMPLGDALQMAYANRQEYLFLQAKLRSAQYQSRAARYERLPTITFTGNYGVTGTVGSIYHGTFLAQGTLSVPLFKEAEFRGDRDVADAATNAAMAQLASFRLQIEAEIRDNMLDVAAAQKLVDVSRSNVDLSHATVSDATDRFRNGIDSDLPVVEAQSSLATAEAQLVNSLYEYNVAKIALARSLGIVDTRYREYLHGPGDATQSTLRLPDGSSDRVAIR